MELLKGEDTRWGSCEFVILVPVLLFARLGSPFIVD
jgi:hypothetical protein